MERDGGVDLDLVTGRNVEAGKSTGSLGSIGSLGSLVGGKVKNALVMRGLKGKIRGIVGSSKRSPEKNEERLGEKGEDGGVSVAF